MGAESPNRSIGVHCPDPVAQQIYPSASGLDFGGYRRRLSAAYCLQPLLPLAMSGHPLPTRSDNGKSGAVGAGRRLGDVHRSSARQVAIKLGYHDSSAS